jgi:hypothetical protein
MAPSGRSIAQVWRSPAATAVAWPTMGTGSAGESVPAIWLSASSPQQRRPPIRVAAQLCARPVAMAMTSVRSGTSSGEGLLIAVPSPSCPFSLFPQHHTRSSSSSAHACRPRAAIDRTPAVRPMTGLGRRVPAAAPLSPSWPASSAPQQTTVPSLRNAHEKSSPAATALAFAKPATGVGMERLAPPPSPSWPVSSAPQQTTAPPVRTAHVCRSPAAIAIVSSSPPTSTAAALGVWLPSPSCPSSLRPQHATVPSTRRTHACVSPATSEAIALASHDRATQVSESLPACST